MNIIQKLIFKYQNRNEFYHNLEPDYKKTEKIFIKEARRLGILQNTLESKTIPSF